MMRIVPLIIFGFLSCTSLGISLEKHGKKQDRPYNAWTAAIAFVLEWLLIIWMVW
jgi:hypothetical protein